jgi:hypothetical protein
MHRNSFRQLLVLLSIATALGFCRSFQSGRLVQPASKWQPTTTPSSQKFGHFMSTTSSQQNSTPPKNKRKILIQGPRKARPVSLNHERDFFRQAARLESMESYLLVSTLTASMSFGALLGFSPSIKAVHVATMSSFRAFGYNAICSAIPVVAGLSAIYGLYATVMFSLTVRNQCVQWRPINGILKDDLSSHTLSHSVGTIRKM